MRLVLCLFLFAFAAQAQPGEVAISVELTPMGDFIARGPISGFAKKKGSGFVAQNIRLKVSNLKSDIDLRDDHMNKKYFEIAKFPEAIMSKGIGKDGKFDAMLTVHGVKKKVSGTYKMEDKMLKGNFKTSLSAFNIKKANYMGVGVVDEVNVEVKLPVK